MLKHDRFSFKPVEIEDRPLVHEWLVKPHVAQWIHGVGLQSTLNGLEKFFLRESETIYWIGYDKDTPFAFLITSPVGEDATTLDLFICDLNYLGKGIAVPMIQEFLIRHFSNMKRVLIDPEATNARAIHVYKKVGFKIIGEFIASWHLVPHYQMELDMKDLLQIKKYHLEHYDTIPKEYEEVLYRGINEGAFDAKGLSPFQPFSIFVKDQKGNILGGASGILFYGSLYLDSLCVDKALRHQGLGTKLMTEVEDLARKRGALFVNLNTMDWEALSFYQKLGYSIEFIREGYEKESKMFMLRKDL